MLTDSGGYQAFSLSQKARGRSLVKPAEEDPAAVALMDRLSRVSRNRWPEEAIAFPKRMPPPPPKKAKAPPV